MKNRGERMTVTVTFLFAPEVFFGAVSRNKFGAQLITAYYMRVRYIP